mgnify:CR=1 FL=1
MDENAEFVVPSPSRPLRSDLVFRAVADRTRQHLLRLLLSEELKVSELVEILGQPQSTISRHLQVLRSAGLVKDRRQGTSVCYSASSSAAATEGDAAALVIEWCGKQPLPAVFRDRLEEAIKRRRDETRAFFQRLGHRWDCLREAAFGEAFAFEAFLALLPREWTVADVGAGTGFLLPALSRHFRRVLAIEPTPAMVECARQRMSRPGSAEVVFLQEELASLSLPDQCCDLAVACLVLHHVAEPRAAIVETLRILKPGGWLLLIEQTAHELAEFRELMQDRLWGFDPALLCRELLGCGLEDVRHTPLREPRGPGSSIEAPGLFVVAARRPGRS